MKRIRYSLFEETEIRMVMRIYKISRKRAMAYIAGDTTAIEQGAANRSNKKQVIRTALDSEIKSIKGLVNL
jgi:hypothetical protein